MSTKHGVEASFRSRSATVSADLVSFLPSFEPPKPPTPTPSPSPFSNLNATSAAASRPSSTNTKHPLGSSRRPSTTEALQTLVKVGWETKEIPTVSSKGRLGGTKGVTSGVPPPPRAHRSAASRPSTANAHLGGDGGVFLQKQRDGTVSVSRKVSSASSLPASLSNKSLSPFPTTGKPPSVQRHPSSTSSGSGSRSRKPSQRSTSSNSLVTVSENSPAVHQQMQQPLVTPRSQRSIDALRTNVMLSRSTTSTTRVSDGSASISVGPPAVGRTKGLAKRPSFLEIDSESDATSSCENFLDLDDEYRSDDNTTVKLTR